jgi:hypothetical protein
MLCCPRQSSLTCGERPRHKRTWMRAVWSVTTWSSVLSAVRRGGLTSCLSSKRWERPWAQFSEQQCTAQPAGKHIGAPVAAHERVEGTQRRGRRVARRTQRGAGQPAWRAGRPGRRVHGPGPTRLACFRRGIFCHAGHAGRASPMPGPPRSLCLWRGLETRAASSSAQPGGVGACPSCLFGQAHLT